MAQMIAILDYGSGNLRSVEKAFEHAARHHGLACRIVVTDDPDQVAAADRLVLPGVGAFAACMSGLIARDGLLEAMQHVALVEKRPFLGVCVGMQLLATQGLEYGVHEGLGWIPGSVRAIEPRTPDIRTPHMGWNAVEIESPHPVLDGLDGEAFYFAHSYYFDCENTAFRYGVTVHGAPLAAAVGRDNLFGVQFHPEKSQRAGLALIGNFLAWSPL